MFRNCALGSLKCIYITFYSPLKFEPGKQLISRCIHTATILVLEALGNVTNLLDDGGEKLLSLSVVTVDQVVEQLNGVSVDKTALLGDAVNEGALALEVSDGLADGSMGVKTLVGLLKILVKVDNDGEEGGDVMLLDQLSDLLNVNGDLHKEDGAVVLRGSNSGVGDDGELKGGEAADAEDCGKDVVESHFINYLF